MGLEGFTVRDLNSKCEQWRREEVVSRENINEYKRMSAKIMKRVRYGDSGHG